MFDGFFLKQNGLYPSLQFLFRRKITLLKIQKETDKSWGERERGKR